MPITGLWPRGEFAAFFNIILRQKFQNKTSEFPGQNNKISDYDNNGAFVQIKIFEEKRILNINFIV